MLTFAKELNVLIVDESNRTYDNLQERLSSIEEIAVTLTTCDFLTALVEVKKAKPDMLIINSEISELEEYVILQGLKFSPGINSHFVVINVVKGSFMLNLNSGMNENDFMLSMPNPDDYGCIIELTQKFCECMEKKDACNSIASAPRSLLETASHTSAASRLKNERVTTGTGTALITQLLLKAGISPKLKGFSFLRDGIHFVIMAGNELSSVTKEVYPEIAKNYSTDAERVERSIRTAIQIAFESEENVKFYVESFGPLRERKSSKKNPSNREFIFTLAEYIKNGEKINYAQR